jgi:3'-phosphoadenosine 5'-phosphosulfate sulfotransferase (PAPS reductase)/FAD synthetase
MPTYSNCNKVVVFANTGKENEETLNFIKACDEKFSLSVIWIEALVNPEKGEGTNYKITNYNDAEREGKIFESVIKKYGLPSKLYRHCTREMKQVAIKKFAQDYFQNDYEEAIGIRADEKHRIGKKFYPLFELGITKEKVNIFWKSQDFRLNLKDYQGNCDLCFLKSKRKKLTILNEAPSKNIWWNEMEKKYSSQFQEKFDMINNLSVDELLEKSKLKFEKSIDTRNEHQIFETEFDIESACFCSNT